MRGVLMISLVLQNLEQLQIDLAAIDPHQTMETADVIDDMVIALRKMLACADTARRQTQTPSDAFEPMQLRAAG